MSASKTQMCSICERPVAVPEKARNTQFCHECEQAWQDSPEREQFASARARFVARKRKEIGK